MDNKRGFELLNNYFGHYYKTQKDHAVATKQYTKALSMYEEMQSKFGASLALYNLGQLSGDLKNYDNVITRTTKL